MKDLCEAVVRRGLAYAPDFLAIDGGEGGSGAAPQALADHMSLPIAEALPRVSRWADRVRASRSGSGSLRRASW